MPNRKRKNGNKKRSAARMGAQEIGQIVGAIIGSKIGMPATGAALGGSMMEKASRIVGRGDYVYENAPTSNSLVRKGASGGSFGKDMTSSFHMRRREFVKNIRVNSTEDFTIDSIVVQPGLSEPFPFLSNIARSFRNYKVRGLVYEYVSMVSSYSTQPAMGTVILMFDPNQGADAPTNKVAMENMAGAVSARPDKNIVLGVECDPSKLPFKQYFVRSGLTPSVTNAVEDFGRFYIATSGLPTSVYEQGTLMGELYVSYDIEFENPALPTLESGFFNRWAKEIGSGAIWGNNSIIENYGGLLYNTYVTGNRLYFKDVPAGSIFVLCVTFNATGSDDFSGLADTSLSDFDTDTWALAGCSRISILSDSAGDPTYSLVNPASPSTGENLTVLFAVEIARSVPTTDGWLYSGIELRATGSVLSGTADSTSLTIYTLGQGQSFAPY
jgi:hypothetical protein